jgi:hypothetical protein
MTRLYYIIWTIVPVNFKFLTVLTSVMASEVMVFAGKINVNARLEIRANTQ